MYQAIKKLAHEERFFSYGKTFLAGGIKNSQSQKKHSNQSYFPYLLVLHPLRLERLYER